MTKQCQVSRTEHQSCFVLLQHSYMSVWVKLLNWHDAHSGVSESGEQQYTLARCADSKKLTSRDNVWLHVSKLDIRVDVSVRATCSIHRQIAHFHFHLQPSASHYKCIITVAVPLRGWLGDTSSEWVPSTPDWTWICWLDTIGSGLRNVSQVFKLGHSLLLWLLIN